MTQNGNRSARRAKAKATRPKATPPAAPAATQQLTRVHLGTHVQTMFGMADADGNVTPEQPIQIQIHKLQPDAFAACLEAIIAERDRRAAETAAVGEDATA